MDLSSISYPAIIVLGCISLIWLISVKMKDASIADIWWGPGFAVIAWSLGIDSGVFTPRHLLAASLFTLWGLRLGIYLANRNLGHEEDHRYQAMRGDSRHFWWVSFFQVFLLQGLLQLVVALPLYAIASSSGGVGALDVVGAIVVISGIATEAIADAQLSAFKGDPANQGKVMRSGIWGWSRHPNYFGNALMWLGFGILGTSAAGPIWIWTGPAIMWFLLLRVSGVTMLEKTIVHRRPAYQAYIDEVSAFIPWPPRRST